MKESLKIVRFCLENLPEGPVSVKAPKTAPKADILSRYEAPRGELVHFIRTNNSDRVERLDIRTPTLANWTSVAVSLVGHNIADIPVVIAAIDPCISCTSRMTILNERGIPEGVMTLDEIRKFGREFYRREGRR